MTSTHFIVRDTDTKYLVLTLMSASSTEQRPRPCFSHEEARQTPSLPFPFRRSYTGVKYLLCPRATQPLASQTRDKVTALPSPTLVTCSLPSFPLKEEMAVAKGSKSQNPCVYLMCTRVAVSLESLFSFVDRFPGRFMDRILMVKCNPKGPALFTGGHAPEGSPREAHALPTRYAFVLSIRSHLHSQINGD